MKLTGLLLVAEYGIEGPTDFCNHVVQDSGLAFVWAYLTGEESGANRGFLDRCFGSLLMFIPCLIFAGIYAPLYFLALLFFMISWIVMWTVRGFASDAVFAIFSLFPGASALRRFFEYALTTVIFVGTLWGVCSLLGLSVWASLLALTSGLSQIHGTLVNQPSSFFDIGLAISTLVVEWGTLIFRTIVQSPAILVVFSAWLARGFMSLLFGPLRTEAASANTASLGRAVIGVNAIGAYSMKWMDPAPPKRLDRGRGLENRPALLTKWYEDRLGPMAMNKVGGDQQAYEALMAYLFSCEDAFLNHLVISKASRSDIMDNYLAYIIMGPAAIST